MVEPVLSVVGLTKSFGAVRASDDISLELLPGEVHALIGPNGAGKSTLVAQIAGSVRPDAGVVRLLGRDVTSLGVAARARLGLGRGFQVSSVVAGHSVLENIALAVRGRRGDVLRAFRAWRRDAATLDAAHAAAARVGLDGRMGTRAAELSHGERRRLELAMALALEPRAFLLDEPMAGLGPEGAHEMTALIGGLATGGPAAPAPAGGRRTAESPAAGLRLVDPRGGGTREAGPPKAGSPKAEPRAAEFPTAGPPVLLVEHDMDVVFALADRVTVLVDGAVLASGDVAAIRADDRVRTAYLGDPADDAE